MILNEQGIYPSYVLSNNFRYIELDNKYIISLICISYPRTIDFLKIPELFSNIKDIDFCYYIKKQDKNKILKKLNYNIATKSAELKSTNSNQIDIDILNSSKDDAKDFRRQIQLNNEEVYNIALYITITTNNKEELYKKVVSLENKLYVNNIICKRANFRQLDVYKESLPIINTNIKNEKLYNSDILMLSKTFVNFFPFITKILWDKKGILIGKNTSNNSIALLDIFSQKYINSNVTILGSSGSGKSYFLKLHIIRSSLKDIYQYVIDLEGEYINLVKTLNGIIIDFKNEKENMNSINIFDIYYKEANDNFLNEKIESIILFITKINKDITDEDIDILKEYIEMTYFEKGITKDMKSLMLMQKESINPCYKQEKDMPRFNELYELLKNSSNKKAKLLSKKIHQFISGKYSFLDCYTNKDIWNILCHNKEMEKTNIILFDLHLLNKEESKIAILLVKVALEHVIENIKQKKILYFDEVWKLINKYSKEEFAEYIFTLFKTLRKRNGSIIIATQDLTDFFAYEDGSYGKSILNNSCIKVYFKTEYLETDFLINNHILKSEEITNIKRLKKGNCIINIENSSIPLEILSSDYEKGIIENEKNISSIK